MVSHYLSIIPLNNLNVVTILFPEGFSCSKLIYANLHAIPIAVSTSTTMPPAIQKNLILSIFDHLEHPSATFKCAGKA